MPPLLIATPCVPKVSPTCTLPRLADAGTDPAAYAYTVPLTRMFCGVSVVLLRPSIVPLLVRPTLTVPLTGPAVLPLPRPTWMLLLAPLPTRRSLKEPLPLAAPLVPSTEASRPSV